MKGELRRGGCGQAIIEHRKRKRRVRRKSAIEGVWDKERHG